MTHFARSSADFAAGIHADVWHAHALARAPHPVQSTGYAALDAELPGGGWPVGALTEVLQDTGIHQEWRLLLPALVCSGTAAVVLVGAPHAPMAPSLAARGLAPSRLLWVAAEACAGRLWATEQALRCADVDAVLLWLSPAMAVRPDQLRRLQMAATEFGKLLFVMRPLRAQSEASPATLRLEVSPPAAPHAAPFAGMQVRLLKRRGPSLLQPLQLRGQDTLLSDLLMASQARPATHEDGPHSALHHALDRTAPRPRAHA